MPGWYIFDANGNLETGKVVSLVSVLLGVLVVINWATQQSSS